MSKIGLRACQAIKSILDRTTRKRQFSINSHVQGSPLVDDDDDDDDEDDRII